MSTPIIFPSVPTLFDANKQSIPAPDPRSRTTSPFFNEAKAVGLPHPKPRFAPSGSDLSSFSL
jgi:hypothetical protein